MTEICGKYLHKDKQVYIEGKIQTCSYEDRDSVKKYVTKVVANEMQMLERAADSNGALNAVTQDEGVAKFP